MQKITPCLWFDDNAEEAVDWYLSIFKHSRIKSITRYGEEAAAVSGRPKGTVMTITFELEGQQFVALNGGPLFTFSPAISMLVNCQNQDEVDALWESLSQGGEKQRCGWLRDKFGVTWQIVPTVLGEMLNDEDAEASRRVAEAMLQMDRIDIEGLEQAYQQK